MSALSRAGSSVAQPPRRGYSWGDQTNHAQSPQGSGSPLDMRVVRLASDANASAAAASAAAGGGLPKVKLESPTHGGGGGGASGSDNKQASASALPKPSPSAFDSQVKAARAALAKFDQGQFKRADILARIQALFDNFEPIPEADLNGILGAITRLNKRALANHGRPLKIKNEVSDDFKAGGGAFSTPARGKSKGDRYRLSLTPLKTPLIASATSPAPTAASPAPAASPSGAATAGAAAPESPRVIPGTPPPQASPTAGASASAASADTDGAPPAKRIKTEK